MKLKEVGPRYMISDTENYVVVVEGVGSYHPYLLVLNLTSQTDDAWILGWGKTVAEAQAHGRRFLNQAWEAVPQLPAQD